ncbi:hypothetical protein C3486_22925 [Streptomyces sp. Ru73]|uniref:hypothetical protein n=1 Tax=Streptomyces sp. Ru73 TaxID=2080748 RepID=UPI000CDD783C|nr:hypothetical protein [Streptomyces sp. Ru73]POX38480.1 hypothetical protein C3486_22925 [Streptomyces sp. Ru73]
MGSLRNPIGPLPSSIYWRRRAVALAILALLVLLVVWAVNLGNTSGDGSANGKGSAGGPATSITPGPNATDSGISQKPGGRDESGDGGGAGGSGTGSGGAGSGGSGGAGGAGGGTGGGTPIGEGGSGSGAGAGSGGGVLVPGGSALANCQGSGVELKLRSVKNSYGPDDRPKFEVTVRNTSDQDCKVDLGRKAAVLTISHTDSDDHLYASDDCPPDTGAALLKVPAGSAITRTVEWDRKPSGPHCATPAGKSAKAGTYLAEITVDGLASDSTSFVLAKD